MAQEYWLKFNENDAEQGPYLKGDLKNLVAEKRILPETLISTDKVTWHLAKRVKGLLAPATTIPPALPPSPPPVPADLVFADPVIADPIQAAFQPDKNELEYSGSFLALYIFGLIIGVCMFFAGFIGVYAFFTNTTLEELLDHHQQIRSPGLSRSHNPPEEIVAIPLAVYLLPGVLLIAAAVTRRVQGRWLLLFASLIIILLDLMNFAMTVASAPVSNGQHSLMDNISVGFILTLVYPTCCIFAFVSWRRSATRPRYRRRASSQVLQ